MTDKLISFNQSNEAVNPLQSKSYAQFAAVAIFCTLVHDFVQFLMMMIIKLGHHGVYTVHTM